MEKDGLPRVDLMIIDCEGAELLVLATIPQDKVTVDRIFCELHSYKWREFGYGPNDDVKFLNDYRLRCGDMYFKEHTTFPNEEYIGPCCLFSELALLGAGNTELRER